jgi:xanthosine utilization system XapX-like protein
MQKEIQKAMQKAMGRFSRGELLFSLSYAVPVLIFLLLDLLSPLLIALLCIIGFVGVVVSSRYYFFDIELLGGDSVLQSFRNSAKKVSGNLWKVFLIRFFVVLINIIWFALWLMFLVLSESEPEVTSTTIGIMTSTFGAVGTIVSTIGISCTFPFSVLVAIHAHIQLSSPKPNSSKTAIETVSEKIILTR